MTKTLFLVTVLFTGICWAVTGDAFELWEGKAVTILNIRKFPDPGSQAIGWLKKGKRITVIDEKKKWYKIIFEIEGKRPREGWVHSGYIQRISLEKLEKEDLSSALEEVREGIAGEELQAKIPLGASEDQNFASKGAGKKLNKTSTPAATRVVVKEQVRMVPREGLLSDRKNVKDTSPEKVHVVRELTREPPKKSPPLEVEGNTTPPPAITSAVGNRTDTVVQTVVPVIEKALKQEPLSSLDGKDTADTQGLKESAKVVLRLLSVVLSCFAILFSYKAIKLAKTSYNTVIQFQRDLQIKQQRENEQGG